MNKKALVENLIRASDELDQAGLEKDAAILDDLISKVAQTSPEQQALEDKWYRKGLEAGQRDGWMTVEIDDISDQEFPDINEVALRHRELWEETDHFNILYGHQMAEDAKRLEGEDGENWIFTWQELRDKFWDGYEQTSGLYKKIQERRRGGAR